MYASDPRRVRFAPNNVKYPLITMLLEHVSRDLASVLFVVCIDVLDTFWIRFRLLWPKTTKTTDSSYFSLSGVWFNLSAASLSGPLSRERYSEWPSYVVDYINCKMTRWSIAVSKLPICRPSALAADGPAPTHTVLSTRWLMFTTPNLFRFQHPRRFLNKNVWPKWSMNPWKLLLTNGLLYAAQKGLYSPWVIFKSVA